MTEHMSAIQVKLVPVTGDDVGLDVAAGVDAGVEAGEGLVVTGEGVVVTGVDGEPPGWHCQYLQI